VIKALHLANNKLARINGDEAFKTNRVSFLNLEANEVEDLDARLTEIMPNLQTLVLDNNRLKELPTYLKEAPSKLRAISIRQNPFRCDCSRTGRFAIQQWLFLQYVEIWIAITSFTINI